MNHALGHCIHYVPEDFIAFAGHTASGKCAAGVAYGDVRIPQPSALPVILPCFRGARGLAGADRCARREWPTPEQVAEAEAEIERAMAAVLAGLCPDCGDKLIRTERRGGGYTARCPKCLNVIVRACGRDRRPNGDE